MSEISQPGPSCTRTSNREWSHSAGWSPLAGARWSRPSPLIRTRRMRTIAFTRRSPMFLWISRREKSMKLNHYEHHINHVFLCRRLPRTESPSSDQSSSTTTSCRTPGPRLRIVWWKISKPTGTRGDDRNALFMLPVCTSRRTSSSKFELETDGQK